MILEERAGGMRRAIAIDFDGCLCADAYPAIGEPNWPVIRRAQAEQRAGGPMAHAGTDEDWKHLILVANPKTFVNLEVLQNDSERIS